MSTPLKHKTAAKPVSYRIGAAEKAEIIKKWGTMTQFFNEKVTKELALIRRAKAKK